MSSMKDVAELAGVSVATVSRVINKNVPVDTETERKVLAAIKRLEYRPNLLARGLRNGSGSIIGLLIPELTHYTFTHIINYVENSAVHHGMNLIIGNTHNDPQREEAFIYNLIRREVDGIIFSRVSDESRVLSILKKSSVPFVVIDRAFDSEDTYRVVLNNYAAGLLAGSHLVSLGHKRIACITGPLNISLCRKRLKGFQEVLHHNGVELNKEYVFEGDLNFHSGVDAIRAWNNRLSDLTAIWAQNDLMAIGALQQLHKIGVNVPEDISVMGMDDIGLASMSTPALTTISQPLEKMCQAAVEMLLLQKDKVANIPLERVLQPSLVIRESTMTITNRLYA